MNISASFCFCNSFNLNLLECKLSPSVAFHIGAFVLILTYWNVNKKSVKNAVKKYVVLILTYWNVNVVEVANDE